MNTVQFVDVTKNIRITKTMSTPKKGSKLIYWLKEACKIIPEIPNPYKGIPQVYVEFEEAYLEYIRFDLRYNDGHKACVVILRNNVKGVVG